MAKNRWEDPFRIVAGAGEFISMAQTRGFDLDQNFTRLGALKVDLHNLKRFSCFDCDGGTGSHHGTSLINMYRLIIDMGII